MGKPSLFGQKHSSRDYSKEYYWGKNQFNSSFPASLVAYMHSKGMKPVYLMIDKRNNLKHDFIVCDELFGIDPLSDDAFYNFEAGYSAYEKFYTGDREKTDLVMINRKTNENLLGLRLNLRLFLTTQPRNLTKTNIVVR